MLDEKKKIERVRGMRDVLPDEYEKRKYAWQMIEDTFEQFGYRGIEVPTIESIDLHLRKSGEAIRQHMIRKSLILFKFLPFSPILHFSLSYTYFRTH